MSRWIIFAVSVPVGFVLGAVIGFYCAAFALGAVGLGGHGSLGQMFMGGGIGAGLGTFAFPLAVYLRVVKRRSSGHDDD